MAIQQNIDYRVSVMDKVGVKITDADGTQRPITADDLLGDKNYIYLAANINTRGEMYIDGVFTNEDDAQKLASELQAGPNPYCFEFFVERHEVLS